jgi:hypothetical protein
MNIPKLEPGFYSVMFDEVRTGKILTTNGVRYSGEGEYFLTFDSLEKAERFGCAHVEKLPEQECLIYDSEAKFLKLVKAAIWQLTKPKASHLDS